MKPAGTILQERYIIERTLDQGGMSVIYLARQIALDDRQVAIKQMSAPRGSAADTLRATEQFRREASTLGNLRHPNLVAVHDFFCEDNDYYIVMEYVEGTRLDTLIEQAGGPIERARVLTWAIELCNVLSFLHGQHPPVIFRDLKPANIIIDGFGHVRLIDFGIAQSFQLRSATSTFVIGAGTPGYASPEQYGTTDADTRTDVYALGATLYTVLTGQAPADAIDRVLGRAALAAPRKHDPDIPAALEAAVLRMMDLQPDERFATIAEARDALAAAAPVSDAPAASREERGQPLVAAQDVGPDEAVWAPLLVLLLLVGILSYVVPRAFEPPPAPLVSAEAPLDPLAPSPLDLPSRVPSPSTAPSPSPPPASGVPAAGTSTPRALPSFSLPPQISGTDLVTSGSGLMYQDTRIGLGPSPSYGDTVEMHYTVWLMNGRKVDSSLVRGRPMLVALGSRRIVAGWEEGVAGMRAGGRRKLIIPAALAYGDRGAPPLIPPGATLVIDVELLHVLPQPTDPRSAAPAGSPTAPSLPPAAPAASPSLPAASPTPSPLPTVFTAPSSPLPSGAPSTVPSGAPRS